MMNCAELARQIEQIQPDASPQDVARLCLLLTNTVENLDALRERPALQDAWKRTGLQLQLATDQHAAMTQELEQLASSDPERFTQEQIWILIRAIKVLIADVTLVKQRQLTAAVRFRGGATTTLTLLRPLTAQQQRATHEDVRRQIDTLLDDYTDAQVAHTLNERGLHTGAGEVFDSASVSWVTALMSESCA